MACGWVCIISPSVFFVANFVCSQSDDHPKGRLTNSGYKPEMKYKLSLTILLYFWLHDENVEIWPSGFQFCDASEVAFIHKMI
jgi:hypothetical protein